MRKRTLLRAVRAAQQPKVSQSQVAMRAGMGLYRYWQIENGERPAPTPQEKADIAAALNASVYDIEWPEVASQQVSA